MRPRFASTGFIPTILMIAPLTDTGPPIILWTESSSESAPGTTSIIGIRPTGAGSLSGDSVTVVSVGSMTTGSAGSTALKAAASATGTSVASVMTVASAVIVASAITTGEVFAAVNAAGLTADAVSQPATASAAGRISTQTQASAAVADVRSP